MEKRILQFNSFDEVIAEIDRLRSGDYVRNGQWILTEICDHLTKTMHVGMEGGMKPYPWILRATILRFMTNRLIKSGRMPSGFKAPQEVMPQEYKADDPQVIDACIAKLRETDAFAGPMLPHPFSTDMTLEKWKRLMLIHSAHHLGFLAPSTGASS